jgi:hypothetical protein
VVRRHGARLARERGEVRVDRVRGGERLQGARRGGDLALERDGKRLRRLREAGLDGPPGGARVPDRDGQGKDEKRDGRRGDEPDELGADAALPQRASLAPARRTAS